MATWEMKSRHSIIVGNKEIFADKIESIEWNWDQKGIIEYCKIHMDSGDEIFMFGSADAQAFWNALHGE